MIIPEGDKASHSWLIERPGSEGVPAKFLFFARTGAQIYFTHDPNRAARFSDMHSAIDALQFLRSTGHVAKNDNLTVLQHLFTERGDQ